jgi:hypothetical protein
MNGTAGEACAGGALELRLEEGASSLPPSNSLVFVPHGREVKK